MHMTLEVSLAYLCTLKIFRRKTTTSSVRFIGHIVSKKSVHMARKNFTREVSNVAWGFKKVINVMMSNLFLKKI